MMKLLRTLLAFVVVTLLTGLTQVGGLVFLLSLLTYNVINGKFKNRWIRTLAKIFSFLILYLTSVFIFIPLLAKPFGRVPLPLIKKRNLQPATILTFLLNRNYVRPQLREAAFRVADKMNEEFPGTVINYLDANFPFINNFPLLPHLSHSDGKKLDLSFAYVDTETGKLTNALPSFIGYGICEAPKANEENIPNLCEQKGYWQYNLLPKIVSQANRNKFEFDGKRTRRLVTLFTEQAVIGKIFIEPHLKTRLGLTNKKIRFHGCQAVRHDDHLHVQLR